MQFVLMFLSAVFLAFSFMETVFQYSCATYNVIKFYCNMGLCVMNKKQISYIIMYTYI